MLALAIPVFASQLLEMSYHFVNGIWVGRAGLDALAALNAAAFFVWLVYSQMQVVSTGTASLVANRVGAGRREEARRVASQALTLGVVVAVLLGACGLLAHRPVLQAMGLSPSVVELGSAYLQVVFLILPMMALDEVMAASLRGFGDTVTPTVVWGGVLVLNIALLPICVSGYGGWTAPLGIVGAGLATGIAMSGGVIAYLALAAMGRLPFQISAEGLLRRDFVPDILRIGFPTSFSAAIFSIVYMGLTRVISGFGTEAVAAVGIGHRVESLSYMTSMAFSLAALTMVGQNKGAGLLARASRCAWWAAGLAAALSLAFTAVMLAASVPLARLFADDAQTVAIASAYIRIVGLSQVFMAVEVVLEGAFSGAGDTIPPMAIGVPLTLARIPVAWYVAQHLQMGIEGVWWVITALMIVRGIAVAAWFARGRWKQVDVARSDFALEPAA